MGVGRDQIVDNKVLESLSTTLKRISWYQEQLVVIMGRERKETDRPVRWRRVSSPPDRDITVHAGIPSKREPLILYK